MIYKVSISKRYAATICHNAMHQEVIYFGYICISKYYDYG